MKILSALFLGILPLALWAAPPLCDDTYYLQSVKQTMLTGTDAKALTVKSVKDIRPDLTNLDPLNGSMSYKIISKFEGACSKAIKPVSFLSRTPEKPTFVESKESIYAIQMFDTNTRVGDFKYDYWFGFFKSADTLRIVLGNTAAKSAAFVNWYLAITYSDSIRDSSHIWKQSTSTYSLTGPDDSLLLEKLVLDETIRKIVPDANHKSYVFSAQFIKVSYGNSPPVVGIKPAKSVSDFSANQIGQMVFIRSEHQKFDFRETMNLLDMMGNKISSLYFNGNSYQWNGKTFAGSDASTGVYFIQTGNGVVGKFFYTR